MGEQAKKTHISAGLLAHVDAGKTTLSEALLYCSGARRTLGRVDHRNAFLDTHSLERARGITIFSKQAQLRTSHRDITLVDTPGHADFAAEAERVMPILDCAVLVISGTDGIQAHTVTLWNLLERYNVPVFLFINKMDLPGKSRAELLTQLQTQLSPGCADFQVDPAQLAETAAMCDEALLENYLQTGTVTEANIRELIAGRRLFPCCFGAGLKLEGVEQLLDILDLYAPQNHYSDSFGARVYKISRDPQGNRLTWLKVTGGRLSVRSVLSYQTAAGETVEEKLIQLRLYSGDKYTAPDEVLPGQLCAVTGLSGTYTGQGLGAETGAAAPVMEPVMTYRVCLPKDCDPVTFLPKLRQLEEEDPQLHILWDDRLKQIHVQIMGKVQLEVLRSLIDGRFRTDVTFDSGRIYYKETIRNTVEGVGHFEPLRHYAEVHLLLEPLPRGSGLVFDTVCSTDVLDINYQRLILGHLSEKTHLGVLTGAPITDIRAMGGEFDSPESAGAFSVLKGILPAAELGDYGDQVSAYTQGRGQLQIAMRGYLPCHNEQSVVEELGYDPEADLENTPDSVFCAHGAGFTVKWHQVPEYMHLESGLKKEHAPEPTILHRPHIDDKELEAIMEREFGPIKRPQYFAPQTRSAKEEITIRQPRQSALIVDGYNVIFAWDDLAETAKTDLEAARRHLLDAMSSYAGYKKCRLVVVFDGYKVKGNPGEKGHFHNIQVVYTKENQTADAYMEALVNDIGKNYAVRVATSDALVQLSSLRSGVLRMSARELREEVETAKAEMRKLYRKR